MPAIIKTMVIVGSTRPGRLGDRVGKFVAKQLAIRNKESPLVQHEVDYMDLVDVKLSFLEKPFHWYGPDEVVPTELAALAKRMNAADCFVIITPEYNHSISPVLTNFLNHFGGLNYAFKPSAICTYSGGPFGGVRAAMQLRALTGELGCIAVSATLPIPTAQNCIAVDGAAVGENGKLCEASASNALKQLEWMAVAMKNQRAIGLPK
jgi:NAD(P)H-dependent FMN reductase